MEKRKGKGIRKVGTAKKRWNKKQKKLKAAKKTFNNPQNKKGQYLKKQKKRGNKTRGLQLLL